MLVLASYSINNPQAPRTPSIIYLLGPEGVGKSTIIKRLSKTLQKKGVKNKVIEIRTDQVLTYIMKEALSLLGYPSSFMNERGLIDVKENKVKLERLNHVRKILSRLQPLFITLDVLSILALTFIRVTLPSFFGYTIIAERFLIDSFTVNYHIVKKEQINGNVLKTVKLLLKFIPLNAFVVILEAPYDTLKKRYIERNSWREPEHWIKYQMRINKNIVEKLRLKNMIINTEEKDAEESLREIALNINLK